MAGAAAAFFGGAGLARLFECCSGGEVRQRVFGIEREGLGDLLNGFLYATLFECGYGLPAGVMGLKAVLQLLDSGGRPGGFFEHGARAGRVAFGVAYAGEALPCLHGPRVQRDRLLEECAGVLYSALAERDGAERGEDVGGRIGS